MPGQVWEWCSTLWGEDMASPTYKYPYRSDDGREVIDRARNDASGAARRVLL
ncbi:hypothetical protein BDV96DRAFT_561009 [Lophiotrema nucula]|uniref:Sulfatase-modifying factor enzyme domain-containing protein n=1 Tax=Lophiotrema nucula TaxID=690887 RepID=A0A6A5ZS74_9PLEO|nr:hypothetical protein BDV96DRAFT_561009 [Lophiotrema nucula]